MKKWNIEKNTAAIEIDAVLKDYGNNLIKQTDEKLKYNINVYQIDDKLTFTFELVYQGKCITSGFDLSLFNDTNVELFRFDFTKSKNEISYYSSQARDVFDFYYKKKEFIKWIDKTISENEVCDRISNALFLSTENGYKQRPRHDIENAIDIKTKEIIEEWTKKD